MEGFGGLPIVRSLRPLESQQDRRSSQACPPTPPQSAGTSMASPPTAVAIVQSMMFSKRQKLEALNALVGDNIRFAKDAKHFSIEANNAKAEVNTVVSNMNSLKQEKEHEQRLKQNAQTEIADLAARVDRLEQDKEDLQTAANLLQAQNAALEEEKAALRSGMEVTKEAWEVEKGALAAGKAKAEEELRGQRTMRLKLQEINDKLVEDVAVSNEKANAMEYERRAAIERLASMQGETTEVQWELVESTQEAVRLKDKLKHVEEKCQKTETTISQLSDELASAQRGKRAISQAHDKLISSIRTYEAENELQRAELKQLTESSDKLKKATSDYQAQAKQLGEDLKQHTESLRVAVKISTRMEEEHAEEVGKLRGQLASAMQDKESMSSKMNKAQSEAATTTNTLSKLQDAYRKLDRERTDVDQRCRKTGQERDAAMSTKKDLEDEVGRLKEVEKEVRQQVELLEQELREEQSFNSRILEAAERHSTKKWTSRPKSEAAGEGDDESSRAKVKETSVTPAKCSTHNRVLDLAPLQSASAGHITPLPDLDEQNQGAREAPKDSAISPAAGGNASDVAESSSSQPAQKIRIPLSAHKAPNAPSQKAASPLSKTTSDVTAPGPVPKGPASKEVTASSATAINLKRKRQDEHPTDPRTTKQSQTPGRRRSGFGDKYCSLYQGVNRTGERYAAPRSESVYGTRG